jgi:hypothetical protein
MRISLRLSHAAVAVVVSFTAMAAAAPASAFDLNPIHIAKKAAKAVTHPADTVKSVAKSAKKAVTHPGDTIKEVSRTVKKSAKVVGDAVGAVYEDAAKVSDKVNILKPAAPLARDFARAVKSKEGQLAGAAGAGIAVATGGLSYAGTMAGGWAYAAHHGKKTYEANKAKLNAEVKKAKAEIQRVGKESRAAVRD